MILTKLNQKKKKIEEKLKKKKENDKTQENKLLTDLVKDEIKIFQKDKNIKKYKKSFDSENDKNNTDTLYGLSHSSISIFINKKDFLSTSIKKSSDSKNINENETVSGILNIMNDSKTSRLLQYSHTIYFQI